MLKKLAVVAVSGLVVCAVCLGAAAALGGKALRDSHFNFDFADWDKPHCDFTPSGKSATRTINWDSDDKAGIAIPADAHYRRGSGDQMVATGDSAAIAHIRVRGGSVQMDCRGADYGSGLEITLPGRPFRKFSIAGNGSLTLEGIDQPELKIEMAGHTNVTASGKAGRLAVEMAGSNDAKLGGLAADNASLELAGSNDAEVSARDDLKVEIAGRGDVKLRIEPNHLKTDIAGSGHIIHPNEL